MFNVKVIGADSSANSLALAKDLLATAKSARLYTGTVYNSNAAARYFQIFDAAAEPADGQVPKLVVQVPSKNTWSFDFGDGKIFSAGIYMCLSTTDTTKTKTGANDGIFDATFRLTS